MNEKNSNSKNLKKNPETTLNNTCSSMFDESCQHSKQNP